MCYFTHVTMAFAAIPVANEQVAACSVRSAPFHARVEPRLRSKEKCSPGWEQ